MNYIAVLVDDLKRCSGNILFAGDVCFADGYLGGIIDHFHMVDLTGFADGECHIFCQCVASRCRYFVERVGLSCDQDTLDQERSPYKQVRPPISFMIPISSFRTEIPIVTVLLSGKQIRQEESG